MREQDNGDLSLVQSCSWQSEFSRGRQKQLKAILRQVKLPLTKSPVRASEIKVSPPDSYLVPPCSPARPSDPDKAKIELQELISIWISLFPSQQTLQYFPRICKATFLIFAGKTVSLSALCVGVGPCTARLYRSQLCLRLLSIWATTQESVETTPLDHTLSPPDWILPSPQSSSPTVQSH